MNILSYKFLLRLFAYWLVLPLGYSGIINWNIFMPTLCENDPLKVVERNGITVVQVGIKIFDLYNINERDMEFALRISLIQVWKDSTVNLNEVNLSHPEMAPRKVEECIWKPGIVFYNSKDAILYFVDFPSKFLKVLPGGYFYRYGTYRVVVSCPMDFHRYPMDSQHCPLMLSALGMPTNKVYLEWIPLPETGRLRFLKTRPVTMVNVKALQFVINPVSLHQFIQVGISGNYSRLQANFTFTRRLTSSLVNSYLPSSLVVILSWVSFWLDPNAVPGRVTLGVTSFLALATQVVHVRSALPSLDYMTALDIWLFGCLVMIFASLIEFTLANQLDRKLQAQKSIIIELKALPNQSTENLISKNPTYDGHIQTVKTVWFNKNGRVFPRCASRFIKKISDFIGSRWKRKVLTENVIDLNPRIIFPICGLFFSVAYWVHYKHY